MSNYYFFVHFESFSLTMTFGIRFVKSHFGTNFQCCLMIKSLINWYAIYAWRTTNDCRHDLCIMYCVYIFIQFNEIPWTIWSMRKCITKQYANCRFSAFQKLFKYLETISSNCCCYVIIVTIQHYVFWNFIFYHGFMIIWHFQSVQIMKTR